MAIRRSLTTVAAITIIVMISTLTMVRCSNNSREEGEEDHHVKKDDKRSKRRISREDVEIIRSMMDYCVDVLLDPSKPPPEDVYPLNKLNVERCNLLFSKAGLYIYVDGRLSVEAAENIINTVPTYRCDWPLSPNFIWWDDDSEL